MNKEIKEKWLKALRSGEYKQGTNCLKRHDNTFCCLGVLSDIYSKEKNVPWTEIQIGRGIFTLSDNSGGTHYVLSPEVMKWMELGENKSPTGIHIDSEDTTLTHINDRLEKNFNEIADIIEKEL